MSQEPSEKATRSALAEVEPVAAEIGHRVILEVLVGDAIRAYVGAVSGKNADTCDMRYPNCKYGQGGGDPG